MPINFKKLKEVIKGKPAPSSFTQPKDYGENYKSQYSSKVEVPTKRHSAPTVTAKPPPPASPKKEKITSEYSQSQMNKDRPALQALKKEKDPKRDSQGHKDARKSSVEEEDVIQAKKTKAPATQQAQSQPTKKSAPPVTKKAPDPKGDSVPPVSKPVPPKQDAAKQTPEPAAKQIAPAPAGGKQAPPATQVDDPGGKKVPPPPTKQPPEPPAKQPPEPPAKQPPEPQAKPIPEPVAKKAPEKEAPTQAKQDAPLAQKSAPTPASPKPESAPPTTTEPAPPTTSAKKAARAPAKQEVPAKMEPTSPPIKQEPEPAAAPKPDSSPKPGPQMPPQQPTEQPKPVSGARQNSASSERREEQQKDGKRSSNPDDVRRSNPEPGKLPPLPTAAELRKKPPEVSGYFVTDISKNEKRFHNLPTQYFFSKPNAAGESAQKKSDMVEEIDTPSSPENKKAASSKRTIKFDEKEKAKAKLPIKRFSLMEGDLQLVNVTVHELPSAHPSQFEYDKYSDDSDDSEFDLNFKDHLRSSFSIFPSDSLASIRRNARFLHPETEEEYLTHRKHFWIVYAIFVICFIVLLSLLLVFIVRYNYGFVPSFPESKLAANQTLYQHEWSRSFSNYHMFLMVVTRFELLGFAVQLYRMCPCVTITNMKFVHGSIAFSAFIATIAGVSCSYAGKEIGGNEHFYSLHSYFGAVSVISSLASLLTGISSAVPLFSWETRVTLIPIHRQIANIVFMSDVASILTGLVQISRLYFNRIGFPSLYPYDYLTIHSRSICLNMLALAALAFVAVPLYVTSNFYFRRRREPQSVEKKDPDQEQMTRVMDLRRSRAKIHEALETEAEGGGDLQVGSRKSFNLKSKAMWKGLQHNAGKSIPLLINETEKRKANFTDVDLLLSLE